MAKQAKVGKEVDRISSLPDELLCHIISFLPLKQAVCTSILSTRWRKVYTSMSNLNFDDCFKWRKSDSYGFMNFVDRVLLYHIGDVDKFRIKCGGFVDSYRVDGWIRFALMKNVRELDLYADCYKFKVQSAGVFTCKTLVALRLHSLGTLFFELKVPVKICLPRLKILHLSGFRLLDVDSIFRLFSSCSVLEELELDFCILKGRSSFNVSIPTLKRLTIGEFHDHEKIMIDAPNLVYFKCCHLPKGFLLKNLNSLVQADIHFGTVFDSDSSCISDHTAAATNLFKGISNVIALRISGIFTEVFLPGRIAIPEFPKLTYLNLDGYFSVGWERLLPHLLSCFPCLETLVFTVNLQHSRNVSKDLLPSKRFPSCLCSRLKTLEILSFQGRKNEMQMVEFFLKNAEVLENFSVQIIARKRQNSAEWRSNITDKLLNLPKASKNCKVLVV